jgi:hypothetical protein
MKCSAVAPSCSKESGGFGAEERATAASRKRPLKATSDILLRSLQGYVGYVSCG